ncbi:MAG: aldo/keto reductase [Rhizobiaceae bacterium]
MKKRPLGRTGIDVSEICLGTMTWGTQNTEAEGHEQMDYAVEQGVNFFDTAEMYPTTPLSKETIGRTEEIIGTWFEKSGKRDAVILATKITGSGSSMARDGAPISSNTMTEAVEGSLRRLRTDYIDLYQLHWPNRGSYHFRKSWKFDPTAQKTRETCDHIHDVLEGAQKLVDAGKIRAIGLSNESAWGTARFLRTAEQSGLPRVASIQNEYSLLHRIFDLDLAELSHHEDVGLLAFSPLGAGMLSGKYADGKIPAGTRRSMQETLNGRWNEFSVVALDKYLDIAKKHGLDPAQMALAWTLTRPFMTATIIGATSMDHLKTNIGSAGLTLSDEVMDEIQSVYRAHPQTM